ncbi:hypothetical protein P8S55_04475 [Halomonas sp. M1]|uniref:hypothetical protein n=1 Tax=Halomonas sp. M1 TaxID=3035470 RepID=UPI002485B59D|nr:hypothetical protein [Halomonas sp. M1]WFE72352.1 hypothetical protein P8S55_04475 [Halomonas sp. M1]
MVGPEGEGIYCDEHHTVHRHRFAQTKACHHLSVEGTFHMRAGQAAEGQRLPGKATSEDDKTSAHCFQGQAIALKQAASSGKALSDLCADTLKNPQGAAS